MTARSPQTTQTLYDQDYYLWLQTTAEQLRQGKFVDLDLENLIEELESMGRSDRWAIERLLTRILEHLLKLAYWETERDDNANHWKSEITNFRIQIKKRLNDSPSLKPYVAEIFEECYSDARKIVSRLIDCSRNTLPSSALPKAREAHARIEQTLDEDWFPDFKDV